MLSDVTLHALLGADLKCLFYKVQYERCGGLCKCLCFKFLGVGLRLFQALAEPGRLEWHCLTMLSQM